MAPGDQAMAIDSISGVPPRGLDATAAKVSEASAAYDDRAQALVAAAAASADAEGSRDLASAAVALTEQKLVNQILYSTFSAQAEQQRSMVKDLTGA